MIDVPTRVKDALREGDRLKEYRFVVRTADDTADDFTIDNDYLVAESVSFDERMCSDKEIKFGLCEGTSLEFQYFDKDNITGRRLKAFVDVQYKDSDNTLKWYTIPMGWFTVDACSRQASTGIIKVTAYNKLQSDYLDNEANADIVTLVQGGEDGTNVMSFHKLLERLLEGYSIETYIRHETSLSVLNSVGSVGTNYIPLYDSNGNPLTYSSSPVYISVLYGRWNTYWNSVVVPDLNTYIQTEVNHLQKGYIQQTIDAIKSEFASWGFSDVYVNVYLSDSATTTTLMPFDTAISNGYALKDSIQYGHSKYLYGYVIDPDSLGEDYLIYTMSANRFSDTHRAKNYPSEDMMFPYDAYLTNANPSGNYAVVQDFTDYMEGMIANLGYAIRVWGVEIAQISDMDISVAEAEAFSDVTIRDLQTAVYETVCQYGQLDRTTDLFSGVELNGTRLLPADDLYPSNTLYPNGTSESSFPSMYSKLWADEGNVRKFRYLIITYKGLDENNQEVEKVLQRTVNADGTDDYNMSDNWLFKNLVWSDNDVGDYADAMVLKMQNLTWFPFEMWCAGLPYIETGDELEISIGGTAYTSYVLRRTLKGIQNLQDEMINGTLDIF